MTLDSLRYPIGAAVGAIATLGLVLVTAIGPSLAILVGALLFAGTVLLLARERPSLRWLSGKPLPIDASVMEQEIGAIFDKLDRIGEIAASLRAPEIAAALTGLRSQANGMIEALKRDPRLYLGVRKVLVTQLNHVETIALHLQRLDSGGGIPAPMRQSARETLAGLVQVFAHSRERMFQADSIDIEARLSLLERDIAAEGSAAPAAAAPAPKTAPGGEPTGPERTGHA